MISNNSFIFNFKPLERRKMSTLVKFTIVFLSVQQDPHLIQENLGKLLTNNERFQKK